jgi:hypothetical protein
MKSIFLEELYKDTEGYKLIEDRYNNLDAPIKDLISRDSLKEDVLEMMESINLTKSYYSLVAQNIAFFLLQIMEPRDLRDELKKDLPDLRKDLIDSLAQKIEINLIGQTILSIIEKNWKEDDVEGEEVEEEMEMSLVPIPPELAQKQEKVNQTQNMVNIRPTNSSLDTPEEIKNDIKPNIVNLENKILQASPEVGKTVVRENIDRTLPKISLGQGDLYREKPE